MGVWFQRNVRSSTACAFTCHVECQRFCVFDFFEYVKTFADDRPISINDHTTNEGTGTNKTDAFASQLQGSRHKDTVCLGPSGSRFN
jgi:hypothetical protein